MQMHTIQINNVEDLSDISRLMYVSEACHRFLCKFEVHKFEADRSGWGGDVMCPRK